jgi:ABC-type polysaccharide/polyol phosphate export permease
LANGVNFLVALGVLVVVLLLLGFGPTGQWLLLPVVVLAQLLFVTGLALVFAAANVYYRDTVVILEIVLQAWMFLTPVFYDLSQITLRIAGADVATVLQLTNPMALYVAAFRTVLLDRGALDPGLLGVGLALGGVVFALGYVVFVRLSRGFGDVL